VPRGRWPIAWPDWRRAEYRETPLFKTSNFPGCADLAWPASSTSLHWSRMPSMKYLLRVLWISGDLSRVERKKKRTSNLVGRGHE
jgi:hypothetical protein